MQNPCDAITGNYIVMSKFERRWSLMVKLEQVFLSGPQKKNPYQ